MTKVFSVVVLAVLLFANPAFPAKSTDNGDDQVLQFLQVTGFHMAIEDLANQAHAAPGVFGLNDPKFGRDWSRGVDIIFDEEALMQQAASLLLGTLDEVAVTYALEFYSSDLGVRLVAAETTRPKIDTADAMHKIDEVKNLNLDPDHLLRGDLIRKLSATTQSADFHLVSFLSVQNSLLLAAHSGEVAASEFDAEKSLQFLQIDASEMQSRFQSRLVERASDIYRDFTNEELNGYLAALEHPHMQEVYGQMHAMLLQLVSNRLDVLTMELIKWQSSQEI